MSSRARRREKRERWLEYNIYMEIRVMIYERTVVLEGK
jgi:hypothetical protein